MADALLTVEDLCISLISGIPIVQRVSLSVGRGEILGLVGESGSGKTTLALALLGYARPGVRIVSGRVTVAGETIAPRAERDARRMRGRLVAYVPQDPATALNPTFRVVRQIREVLRGEGSERQIQAALDRVGLPATPEFERRFPHQLSGGQQQRVMIAAAIAGEPPLIVFDEPTTGLDVVTQAQVLDEVRRLRSEVGATMVYVSHDLAVVASIADQVAVMYAGSVVEQGDASALLRSPCHPYTRGLVNSIPDHLAPRHLRGIAGVALAPGERGNGCPFAPRCSLRVDRCDDEEPVLEDAGDGRLVRCFRWRDAPPLALEPLVRAGGATRVELLAVEGLTATHRGGSREIVIAAQDVSFTVGRNECVALVGESGSGKTTIARCVAGLHSPDAGVVRFDGESLAGRAQRRSVEQRRRIQIVFQNPYESLNPRHRVADSVARPAILFRNLDRREAAREATRLLEQVRLPTRLGSRYPGELSGGEQQRVAIARALAANPELMICDEITSALDVSVQAAVLGLLDELRRGLGLAILFISHDLGVVASIADRAIVLERGNIREQGPVDDLLQRPTDPYTRALVDAAPRIVPNVQPHPDATGLSTIGKGSR